MSTDGPLLIAANHPNSFLDAIILATLFKNPIYSLARGDAFSSKPIATILTGLNILPVYREREGTENLYKNYDTFDACINIFKKNGIVLIFSEALCENEWHLRPLKKGTARLAVSAWQQNIPLKILPVGINYNSFKLLGKNIHLNFGKFIELNKFEASLNENGKLLNDINTNLQQQLQQAVYEIAPENKELQFRKFSIPVSNIKKIILAIPAAAGVLLHIPFYFSVQKIIENKTFNTGHYDSVLIAIFIITYPFYLAFLSAITYLLFAGYWWTAIILFTPFTLWSYIQLSQQTDR